eukprot:COSAG01_NODE_4160_length_5287_cov_12.643986_1_plen_113_part_00
MWCAVRYQTTTSRGTTFSVSSAITSTVPTTPGSTFSVATIIRRRDRSREEEEAACDTLVLGCHTPLKSINRCLYLTAATPFFLKELPRSRTTTLLKLLHQHHCTLLLLSSSK